MNVLASETGTVLLREVLTKEYKTYKK